MLTYARKTRLVILLGGTWSSLLFPIIASLKALTSVSASARVDTALLAALKRKVAFQSHSGHHPCPMMSVWIMEPHHTAVGTRLVLLTYQGVKCCWNRRNVVMPHDHIIGVSAGRPCGGSAWGVFSPTLPTRNIDDMPRRLRARALGKPRSVNSERRCKFSCLSADLNDRPYGY